MVVVTPREIVPGVAEAIEGRRKELGLSPGDLAKAAGVTTVGLAPLRRGERRAYQDRLTLSVARALRWTPDSIDRLLRGEPAIETERGDLDARLSQLDDLQAQVTALAETVAEQARVLAALMGDDELRSPGESAVGP